MQLALQPFKDLAYVSFPNRNLSVHQLFGVVARSVAASFTVKGVAIRYGGRSISTTQRCLRGALKRPNTTENFVKTKSITLIC
jgi:hypothetical protein